MTAALVILGTIYLLWVFYLAVMALLRAHKEKQIGPYAVVPGYITLAIGLALDMAVNVFVLTFVFLELPHQLLVTQRLKYHVKNSTDWRYWTARWLCRHYLNPFDPSGDHCD